jgi:hypothetical protein
MAGRASGRRASLAATRGGHQDGHDGQPATAADTDVTGDLATHLPHDSGRHGHRHGHGHGHGHGQFTGHGAWQRGRHSVRLRHCDGQPVRWPE